MRIAVVNDLALVRAILRKLVESVPGYRVAWEAADGAQAVAKAAADRPDAILMDLVMPGVNGAEATRRIMAKSPCPVVIVTSSLGANHSLVYEALGAGGLDAYRTPTLGPGGTLKGADPIISRLARLTRQPVAPPSFVAPSVSPPVGLNASCPLIAVGASTGGPDAVARLLSGLGPNCPAAVVVVQHIGADFTPGLSDWLAGRSGMRVGPAAAGDRPAPGRAYVAGGDNHLVIGANGRFAYTPDPIDNPYRPSVDAFFESLAGSWPSAGVAALLTGMGSDGARGLAALRARGWHTIAQDEATCVVYGMPKAAVALNAAAEVLPIERIGPACRQRLTAPSRP